MGRVTSTELSAAVRHLRAADPKLARFIDAVGPCTLKARRDRYAALVRAIVGQQLSTKAAATIYGRVTELLDGHAPTPAGTARLSDRALRGAGLSGQKVRYLRDLTERVQSKHLPLHRLGRYEDEEVIRLLTEVRGIGRWTAEMFLMFVLMRMDVLPVGDLGIQNGFVRVYGLRKRPPPERMHRLAAAWRPYRTVGSWYLWRSLDAVPV